MNCTTNTRYLGRTLTLSTVDGAVRQINHEERLDRSERLSFRRRTVKRDEMSLAFEDGSILQLAVCDPRFKAHPGQRVTAVRTGSDNTRDSTAVYLYNHDTKRGFFDRAGMGQIKRSAPSRRLLVLVPLLLLLGLWITPAPTRATMVTWVEANASIPATAGVGAYAAETPAWRAALPELSQSVSAAVDPESNAESRSDALHAAGKTLLTTTLAGWQQRDWIVFGVLSAVSAMAMYALGSVLLLAPATMKLRRRIKRLMKQHRRALAAA